MDFRSSYLSETGELLNLTWNLTNDSGYGKNNPNTIFSWDDAAWIMSACFIIFGMQTGFGMLESGCVSLKNEVNIMMKNVKLFLYPFQVHFWYIKCSRNFRAFIDSIQQLSFNVLISLLSFNFINIILLMWSRGITYGAFGYCLSTI